MARELILVRHATIATKHRGRFIGSTDVSLSEEGRRQAGSLAKVLQARIPSRCFCSPMKRSLETARLAVGDAALKIESDPDLCEIDFGKWEDRGFEEIQKSDPQLVDRWAAFERDFAFPGGEKVGNFLKRVSRAADRMVSDPADVVLAFTHGGVIRAIICHLLNMLPKQYVMFDARPASITTFELFDGKAVLNGLNDQCHLREG